MPIQNDQERKVLKGDDVHNGGAQASTQAAAIEKEKDAKWDWPTEIRKFGELIAAKKGEVATMELHQSYLVAGHYNDERKAYLKNVLGYNKKA